MTTCFWHARLKPERYSGSAETLSGLITGPNGEHLVGYACQRGARIVEIR